MKVFAFCKEKIIKKENPHHVCKEITSLAIEHVSKFLEAFKLLSENFDYVMDSVLATIEGLA